MQNISYLRCFYSKFFGTTYSKFDDQGLKLFLRMYCILIAKNNHQINLKVSLCKNHLNCSRSIAKRVLKVFAFKKVCQKSSILSPVIVKNHQHCILDWFLANCENFSTFFVHYNLEQLRLFLHSVTYHKKIIDLVICHHEKSSTLHSRLM